VSHHYGSPCILGDSVYWVVILGDSESLQLLKKNVSTIVIFIAMHFVMNLAGHWITNTSLPKAFHGIIRRNFFITKQLVGRSE